MNGKLAVIAIGGNSLIKDQDAPWTCATSTSPLTRPALTSPR